MKDFAIILQELIDAMDLTTTVNDVVGDQIFVCKTLHLRELRVIKDELDNEYTVVDIANDEWIQVTPIGNAPDPFEGETVVFPPVYYIFGTPLTTNIEYDQLHVESGQKTPLIWLWENYRETYPGIRSSIEREVRPRIFFMDETEEDEWTNEEHHKWAIQPMMNLSNELMSTIDGTPIFKRTETSELIPRSRFGRFVDPEGNEEDIIDEYLSGVELQPALVKYKQYSCEC